MTKRNIIVIGASAGGFDSLKKLVSGFSADLEASVFIVWHISPDISGILPQVLSQHGPLPAANAIDGEPILKSRIYVAPPDHHLLIENDTIRVKKGPKENLFRPAIDPLFRSAAYHYGNKAIGVILSGALDDGVAGLWTIKQNGGIAVVQDPKEASVPSMPATAIREVAVDHIVPISEMSGLLSDLCNVELPEEKSESYKDELTKKEIDIAEGENAFRTGVFQMGELTPFTCPECHGVLAQITEGARARYRCHTGHAFSAETLLMAVNENIEDSIYNAIRGLEENVMLLNHVGDHFAEMNEPRRAADYFKRAKETSKKSDLLRETILGKADILNGDHMSAIENQLPSQN